MMSTKEFHQALLAKSKLLVVGLSGSMLLLGCQTQKPNKAVTRERQPDSNVKSAPADIQPGMGTNEVLSVLGKPFLATPLAEHLEIWQWPSPKSRPFDNHFAILSQGKVVFVPKKSDSTPAEVMDAAWVYLNRETQTIVSTNQVDWEAKTATVQVGDSLESVKQKLGVEKWWDEYQNLYATAVAPSLDLYAVVFEKNKVVRTKTLPYNDYFAFTRGEKEEADQKVRAAYVAAHPEIEARIKDSILSKKLCTGMLPAHVELSWGPPEKKSQFDGTTGPTEQWIYPDRTYLYFAEGKLLSWQKTE